MPSKVIQTMHYDPDRQELLIVFRGSRGTYRYFDVPAEEWEAFLAAESKGTYLNRIFKQKEYPYEKTEEIVRLSGRPPGDVRLEWGETAIVRKRVQRVEPSERATKVRA
jgi:hypothetical protein